MSDLNKLKELANTVDFWGSASGWQSDELHATIHFALEQASKLEAAEAELSRRDSAAGEPVYQMRLLDGEENCNDWVEVTEAEYGTPTTEKYGKWERRKLYTAAQPSALPPEVTTHENVRPELCSVSWTEGANWMRDQAKALGSKMIKLPEKIYTDHITVGKASPALCYQATVDALKQQGFTVEDE